MKTCPKSVLPEKFWVFISHIFFNKNKRRNCFQALQSAGELTRVCIPQRWVSSDSSSITLWNSSIMQNSRNINTSKYVPWGIREKWSSLILNFFKFWISFVYFFQEWIHLHGHVNLFYHWKIHNGNFIQSNACWCSQWTMPTTHYTQHFLILWADHSKPPNLKSNLIFFYKCFISAFNVVNLRDKHSNLWVHDVQLKLGFL